MSRPGRGLNSGDRVGRPKARRRRARLVITVLAPLFLAACGDDGASLLVGFSPTPEADSSGPPPTSIATPPTGPLSPACQEASRLWSEDVRQPATRDLSLNPEYLAGQVGSVPGASGLPQRVEVSLEDTAARFRGSQAEARTVLQQGGYQGGFELRYNDATGVSIARIQVGTFRDEPGAWAYHRLESARFCERFATGHFAVEGIPGAVGFGCCSAAPELHIDSVSFVRGQARVSVDDFHSNETVDHISASELATRVAEIVAGG